MLIPRNDAARSGRWHGLATVFLSALLSGLVSCGGGGSGDGGEAFVSNDYVAHLCTALGCIFDWYDDSYPGVDVSWANLTVATQGAATSGYGAATSWAHLWSASEPVAGGLNQLQLSAADPAGNTATTTVSSEYMPPAPNDLRANTGDGEIMLFWSPVPVASAYEILSGRNDLPRFSPAGLASCAAY